jgi:hypothetical protein
MVLQLLPRFGIPTAKPAFVAEGAPAPFIQLPGGSTVLGPAHKVLVVAGISRELNESLPETAVAVVGRALADACNAIVDKTAFDTNASASSRPAGLLYNVTPLTPTAAAGQATLGEMMARTSLHWPGPLARPE